MIARLLATKFGRWLIALVVLILILIWQWSNITAFFRNQLKFSKNRYVDGGGEVPPTWVRDELPALVKELHDRIQSVSPIGRCSILQKVNDLNDNQLRAFANSYRSFYNKFIIDELDSIWILDSILIDACISKYPYPHIAISNRMKNLNII